MAGAQPGTTGPGTRQPTSLKPTTGSAKGPQVRDVVPVRKGRGQGVALAKEKRRQERQQRLRKGFQDTRQGIRTTKEGYHQAQGVMRSMVKLHKDISSSYTMVRDKHVRELRQASVTALEKIKKPSLVRYGPYIVLSGLVDFFISPLVIAAWATVAGGIVVTLAVMIYMAVAGRLLIGKHAKNAANARKEYDEKIKEVRQDIRMVRAEYKRFRQWAGMAKRRHPKVAARVASTGARLGRAAKKIKPVGKALQWLAKLAKNPIFKQISEAIPVWNIIPWWTIGAVTEYISHRSEWKEAQRLLSEYSTTKDEIIGITDDMYQTRLDVVGQEIVNKNTELNRTRVIATA